MSMPRVAIVGRPNVGKSSLMNLLAQERVSIVDSTPGVTRDRVAAVVELRPPGHEGESKLVEVVDTGGYGVYTAEHNRFNEIGEDLSRLSAPVEAQIDHAVRSADAILFVVDAQAGLTALDETFAQILRQKAAEFGGIPVRVVANKTDGESWEPHAYEAAALGFGEPILVSAKNKFRRRLFLEELFGLTPEESRLGGADESAPEMRVAIVGKRNAGKSTFVNALAGEERVIVSEIAGTTRDAVDVRFEIDGRACVAIDTAGLRKRKSIPDRVEWYARDRALNSVDRADVTILMIDATERISQVDKNLSKELQERYAPTVIVVNKWDLVEGRIGRYGRPVDPEDYRKYLEEELVGLSRAPIVFASAKEGRSLREIIEVAFDLHEQATSRVGTGELNRMMTEILEERGPSSKLGRQAKIYYVSQVAVSPPTIVMVVNQEDLFKPEYRRYLLNRLAERTPFAEVPIRLIIRERKRAEVKELISGDYRKRKQLERELESASDVETNQPKIALDGSKPIWESMAEHEGGRSSDHADRDA